MQRSTLQRIEYGQTGVNVDRLWALADVLSVPVTWLLADDWSYSTGGGEGSGEWPDDPPPARHPIHPR